MPVLKPMDVLAALKTVRAPGEEADIVTRGWVEDVLIHAGTVRFRLTAPLRAGPEREALLAAAREAVGRLAGVKDVQIEVPGGSAAPERPLAGVRRVVAVASGKGGVGKSTVAANLALALQGEGATVGLLDADLYGPSVPTLFQVQGPLRTTPEQKILPVQAQGLHLVSIGFMAGEGLPVIWRGPMVAKMLQQLLQHVAWPALDYLIIDLPPGTGDTQLTLCQQAPLTGAVIVTTPQKLSLVDAHRGLEMFRKLNVPVLGLVENMSGFTCPHCGKVTPIFRQGGGKEIAHRLGIPFLGAIPLDPAVVLGSDEGEPVVRARPESPAAEAFRALARAVAAAIPEGGAPEDLRLTW